MPIDNRINNMVTELHEYRQKKTEAEKMEKAILEALKPLVDPKFDKLPDQPIVVGDIQFTRTPGENRSISADLLLERGVAPDVVSYSTKVTKYVQYRTKLVKKCGGADRESVCHDE